MYISEYLVSSSHRRSYDEKLRVFTFKAPPGLIEVIDIIAAMKGVNRSSIIRRALLLYIKKELSRNPELARILADT